MSVKLCRGVVLGKGGACCRLYTLGWMDVWLGYSFGGTIVLICSLDNKHLFVGNRCLLLSLCNSQV